MRRACSSDIGQFLVGTAPERHLVDLPAGVRGGAVTVLATKIVYSALVPIPVTPVIPRAALRDGRAAVGVA